MPGIQKLHLEEAFEDSPRTRQLLSVFEEDATELKKYTAQLHFCCQRILNAQNELSSATQALSQHLTAYDKQNFVLNTDDSILGSTLKQFSSYLDDLSSMQQVFSAQMVDSMMYPLTRFLQADLEDAFTLSNRYQFTYNELEQSLTRYMKLPKKKDNEKLRQESNEELYAMRKKYHQISLHHYASLNSLQYKRKCHLLQPLLGYFQSQKSYLQMCTDAMCRAEIDNFLENITASVHEVKQELNGETQKTVTMIDVLEQQASHLYRPEPIGDMPYIPPNTSLNQKSGYMFMRSRQMVMFRWDRNYYFIQGGNIMIQNKSEVAGSLLIDLNEPGLFVEPTDCDDRRFVFHLSSPLTKRTVILQAENERDRDEWIHTIRNIIDEEAAREKRTKKLTPMPPQSQSPRSKSTSEGVVIPLVKDKRQSVSTVPRTPPSSPVETESFFMDTPIQFDMISPNTQQNIATGGPPKRINPFDQSSDTVLNDSTDKEAIFSQIYVVRFCGSMEVRTDKGERLIHATIRQIMAARAIHNIFKMTESQFLISSNAMRLLDPSNMSLRLEFALEDVAYWSPHKENKRLFGFITRSRAQTGPSFACHVFESDVNAEEICDSISTATTIAFQALLEKKAKASKERDLLLYNISHLPDKDMDDEDIIAPLTGTNTTVDDGENNKAPPDTQVNGTLPDDLTDIVDPGIAAHMTSEERTSEESLLNPPSTEHRGDGDERHIEGAESQA